MPKAPDNVVMYILMRDDLGSLNPGKAIIQGTHAANQCVEEMPAELAHLHSEWKASTGRGFGTGVSLACCDATMRKVVLMAKEAGLYADITHDPTYPVPDGKVTHYIPVDTCAFLFGRFSECRSVLDEVRRTAEKDDDGRPTELNWYP